MGRVMDFLLSTFHSRYHRFFSKSTLCIYQFSHPLSLSLSLIWPTHFHLQDVGKDGGTKFDSLTNSLDPCTFVFLEDFTPRYVCIRMTFWL